MIVTQWTRINGAEGSWVAVKPPRAARQEEKEERVQRIRGEG